MYRTNYMINNDRNRFNQSEITPKKSSLKEKAVSNQNKKTDASDNNSLNNESNQEQIESGLDTPKQETSYLNIGIKNTQVKK